MSTLLIELLTEELPSKALARLSEAFVRGLFDGLSAQGLLEEDAAVEGFATPHHLVASITGVCRTVPDRELCEKVLPVVIVFDTEGKPAMPLVKRLAALAKTVGVEVIIAESLEYELDGKAEALFYCYIARGAVLADGLQTVLSQTIVNLPIPKVMTHQRPNGENVQFVRPAHKLTVLLDNEVIPVSAFGLQSDDVTLGHRFPSAGEIVTQDATSYASTLESQGKVIAGYGKRKEAICTELLKTIGADMVVMPEAPLDEVNALAEWPVVYPCHFEEASLAIPQECLTLIMRTNQKYFALTDAQGHLHSHSLIASDITTDTSEVIIQGSERVVRPRLADARFLFEQDKKKPLADHVPLLSCVVYHNRIGTQPERVSRLQAIAGRLTEKLGADTAHISRGALLVKADLLTDMVGEFPELQGMMGTYHARHDGEPDDVVLACSEYYQPRSVDGVLPSTVTGTVVALADKPEALIGIRDIGLQPTGEKDPSVLRRHALDTLRMLIEKSLALTIDNALQIAAASFDGIAAVKPSLAAIIDFLYDRLRGYLKDKGYSASEVEAVVSRRLQRLDGIAACLEVVRAFAVLSQAEALAAANKCTTNILKKTDVAIGAVQPPLLKEDVECALHQSVVSAEPQVHDAFICDDFTTTLKTLAGLREVVDTFSDGVMVMTDDTVLCDDRLALLAEPYGLMNRVADISKLAARSVS